MIDAFSVPQPMWDATRKRFYLDATPHTLLPDALAKVQVVLGRLQMIHQRLLRSDTFHARILRLPDDPDGSSRATVQVPPSALERKPAVRNLLSLCGFGFLSASNRTLVG